uniref:Uncharacterized protein n=1 Tax=Ornithodoros turicata TaxID=34597 RepID=A0A2R5L7L8_9ACAR
MDRKGLIGVLGVICDVDITWRNIKQTLIGTAAAATSVFVGGIAFGPPGFLLGTLGSLAVCMDHKEKMVSVTKKLIKEQKEKLRKRLQKLLEDINGKIMKKMADYLLQYRGLHKRVMDRVLSFLKQAKDSVYTAEEPVTVVPMPDNYMPTELPVRIVDSEVMQQLAVNALKQELPQYVEKEKVCERARALVR